MLHPAASTRYRTQVGRPAALRGARVIPLRARSSSWLIGPPLHVQYTTLQRTSRPFVLDSPKAIGIILRIIYVVNRNARLYFLGIHKPPGERPASAGWSGAITSWLTPAVRQTIRPRVDSCYERF